jgi:hypothetical protein
MPTILADEGPYVTLSNINLHNKIEKVPPMVYRVGTKDEEVILIKDRERFKVPTKRYGAHDAYKASFIRTYGETKGTTGILLTGLKGAGKSLLAEDTINEVIDKFQRPCLMITSAIPSSVIKRLILAMGKCSVYFDEFGKYYEEEERNKMLTLFSDSDLEGVMFIVTSNHIHELSDYMIHRPGRFLYKINYEGMQEDAILEVIEELKLPPAILAYILDYCKCHRISFDMLRVVAKVAAGAKDLKAFKQELKIHNVPDEVYANYNLREVLHNGEEFKGDTRFVHEDDGTIVLELRDPKSNEIIDSGKFEWLTASKVETAADESEWRVVISPTITVKINRNLSPYKQRAINSSKMRRPHMEDDYPARDPNDPWGGPPGGGRMHFKRGGK